MRQSFNSMALTRKTSTGRRRHSRSGMELTSKTESMPYGVGTGERQNLVGLSSLSVFKIDQLSRYPIQKYRTQILRGKTRSQSSSTLGLILHRMAQMETNPEAQRIEVGRQQQAETNLWKCGSTSQVQCRRRTSMEMKGVALKIKKRKSRMLPIYSMRP